MQYNYLLYKNLEFRKEYDGHSVYVDNEFIFWVKGSKQAAKNELIKEVEKLKCNKNGKN